MLEWKMCIGRSEKESTLCLWNKNLRHSVTSLPLLGQCLRSNNFCPYWLSNAFNVWGFWHRRYETAHYYGKLFARETFEWLELIQKTGMRKVWGLYLSQKSVIFSSMLLLHLVPRSHCTHEDGQGWRTGWQKHITICREALCTSYSSRAWKQRPWLVAVLYESALF